MNQHLLGRLIESDIVVCSGIGKSARVAALVTDLFQSVGVVSTCVNAVDLLHGGVNVLHPRGMSTLIFFTHSGFTTEVLTAMTHVKELKRNVQIVFVTSAACIEGADVVLSYKSEENNRHGTIPVQASIAQLHTIGEYVDAVANLCTTEYLHQGHPKGNLARVYERTEGGV